MITNRKEYMKQWQHNNKDKLRENQKRWRSKNPNYQKEYRQKTNGYSESRTIYNRNYNMRYPKRYKATTILNNAVRDGKIIRPNNCSKCNKECKPEGHHEDYDKPLNVIWLCNSCHGGI